MPKQPSISSSVYQKTVREYVMRRDGRLCQICKRHGRNEEAKEVDHIIARADGGDVFDVNNCQAICLPCHYAKTAQERRARNLSWRGEPPKMINGQPNPSWLAWREQKINSPI